MSSESSRISRRELLRAVALGGAFVAGELWIPGQRLISIPSLSRVPLSGWSVVLPRSVMIDAGLKDGDLFEGVVVYGK